MISVCRINLSAVGKVV